MYENKGIHFITLLIAHKSKTANARKVLSGLLVQLSLFTSTF